MNDDLTPTSAGALVAALPARRHSTKLETCITSNESVGFVRLPTAELPPDWNVRSSLDFPPYIERFDMSSAEPGEDSQIAAIICREGLGPLVHTADTARSMYTATRINTYLNAFSAFLGVVVAALRLLGAGSLSIGFLFAFMLFFALLTAAVSFFNRG